MSEMDRVEIKARVCSDLIMKSCSTIAINGNDIPGIVAWNVEQKSGRSYLRLELWLDLYEIEVIRRPPK